MTEARSSQARPDAERAEGRSLELPQFKGRPGWEFTDISGLDLAAYAPVTAPDDADPAETLFDVPAPAALPEGVIVAPIDQAPRGLPTSVVAADDVFTMLNDAAEYRAGSFVYVPRGVVLEQPISLSTVQADAGTLLNQRTVIVLEEGAQAEVWEQYLSGSAELDG